MRLVTPAVVVLLVLAGVGGVVVLTSDGQLDGDHTRDPSNQTASELENASMDLITSDTERAFRAYVSRSDRQRSQPGVLRLRDGGVVRSEGTPTAVEATADSGAAATEQAVPSRGEADNSPRYGETNVQVDGVDEPDVLKTVNGRFYYALPERHRYTHHETPRKPAGRTVAVDATDPGTAEVTADINRSGRMLVDGNRLVVVGERTLSGYDVSNPDAPELVWERTITGRVAAARLHDGQVYLVIADSVDDDCQVEPLGGTTIACTDIHHPRRPVPVDVTYTALQIATADGDVADRFSFVGGGDATVYMSTEGLYVTYLEQQPTSEVRLEFLLSEGRPLLDDQAVERLRTVRSYDLSPAAQRAEVRATIRHWLAREPADRRRELADELEWRYRTYLGEHKRTLDRTHIVRLTLDGGLSQAASGSVPGRVLNQFSFDAHEGTLRVATTVGERPAVESANDVYVLDVETLSVQGSVTGMGEGQRVYGVRFIGDKGYVITYRQVDPLHVIDLSDPTTPEETGQLKLPGFSRYLHPLDDGRLLGIGEEGGRVKAVVFDVSDPANPTVAHSRVLDARYSAVAQTHHAFMRDARHGVVFLPTERGGYVLSERDLSTVRRVHIEQPRRARYAGDHLYVFGRSSAVVIDERTWNRTAEVTLTEA